MNTLSELYYSRPRPLTDKGDCHDYINSYYNHEFSDKKDKSLTILEIGLYKGGSCELWSEWFTNATLYGIEINPFSPLGRTIVHIGDAYNESMLGRFEGATFDYIIDDGPHSLQSQIDAIRMWGPKLKLNGKLIIEDIQSIDWLPALISESERCGFTYKVFDIRHVKNRYDDIIFEATKCD